VTALDHVPVIDLAPFRTGGAAARHGIAAAIDRALVDIGFLVVTGHGVAPETIAAIAETSRAFFDAPLAERLAVRNTTVGSFRGYLGLGDENFAYTLDKTAPPDIKESFVIGRFETAAAPYWTEGPAAAAFAPNVWPEGRPDLRAAYEAYYKAMERLVATVMQAFAVALGLPEDFFADKFDRHASTLRATNYPDQAAPPRPGQLRAGEHSDYGAVTVLLIEDRPGGLEVRTRAGDWVAVPALPGSFVVNIGDLMMNWTNDRWLSNLHRVANPPPDAAGSTRRQSIVYFANPNPDAPIACIPTCTGPGNPPKYPVVTAGEHRRMKIVKSAQAAG
jgi:isopenicillin N synthase-like dioxygenase